MKIPKKLKVSGREIFIKIVPKAFKDKNTKYPDDWLGGTCNNITDTIKVAERTANNTKFSKDLKLQTFLHEMTHWILNENGVDSTQNEVAVDSIAAMYKQLFEQMEDNHA